MTHTITHTEFTNDYWAGYESAREEIAQMGWEATRDKFNLETPSTNLSMPAYYYAQGQMQALLQFK